MSSDSDDEDELLQMALKEQAQRDLNYQKPPSSSQRKPVVNFVQPPKTTAAAAAAAAPKKGTSPAQNQKNRRVVEDDDDSELEMLSISSGDEEVTKDRGGGGGGAKGRVAGGGGGRGGKEDDRGWDGEEPDCWKRVDEAELARRVREMRETRTAPVAQKYERKPSAIGRKGLNNLQSFPRGMECIDPLGLGIIDNRTLRLITESSDSSPKSDKESLDNNLREKLLYFSEKFDAKLFLSRIHQDTSAADLEGGALALKTDLKGRTQQRKQLVKDNFDCFVSCKTTIDDIESKLKRIEEDPEGSGTSHLFNCMQGVSSLANRAFEPLFERQAQAEKIRSVQGMLQRFRTLFNLPSTIRGSISKGEYDLAVREYKKAKSIALPSHVNILKRVLEEVEKVMHEFKGTLYKSMEDPQIDLTNLENTVRLLLELEPDSDPVWHYLSVQNHRIRGLLEKCTLDHEARMETLHNQMRERAISDAKWRQIQQNLNQSSDVNYSLEMGNIPLPVDSQPIDLTGEEVDVLRGKYIRRLTAVLIHHIPAFWKVALSVFSGKFAKSSQVSSESNVNTSSNKTEEKVGDGRYSTHSLDEVAGMIRSTISAYEVKVHNTFRDLEESNILQSYMSDAIKDIARACQAFEAKESAPPTAVMALRALQAEITKIYILRLCSWMRATTEEISKEETWLPVSILERNKSPYTISILPLAFRSVIASAMDQISLMIQSLRSEARKSEDMFAQLQDIQESVRLAFLNCFLDFAGHLEQIGSELAQNKSSKETPHLQNGYAYDSEENPPSDLSGNVVDSHKKLLIVLSNIGYCKDELSYELYNKYRNTWQQSREKDEEDSDTQDLVMSFSGLEEKVLAQYTFAKANMVRTAAMNYLLNSGVQWGATPAVKGVRDAAVELLHTLVAVHSEVFAGAKPLLDKTLGILVEGLIDTFLSLLYENKSKDLRSLDSNGFCQLMLELEYFETILNPYFTPDARESLKSLQGVLLEKATENVAEAVENPGHQRRSTRGSEDALDDRQQGMTVSPDDLIALAQQCSSELLQAELERTRINTACFVESIPLDAVPESAKAAYGIRGSMDSPSRNYRGIQAVASPSFGRQRRR
ncbi:exocyst complex component SEC5A isoform X1 [Ricinus communis]|uniref:exocyst complex component SEC5A isoform X1 n=1 Tax=Ricinus communis TaxID=3988 RepID=UPI00201A7823|nr:exocyst complex component SEC5A isoform X1 [Ricinus communis]XP_048226581.1 exocyst complex component SEC5A isoform X1 [Ricinus communis]XP_048226582.1 exocyst complex component SEC5A isoform X1 [Ricinus communis]XP_048226583.1 exocyst complex component SEC5A isoform X1 [Ricinus communis]XP_048226584.1 exocyst complex component SEC5A isoform X1 [Ricinus communis]XP_048226585.1 exocyst complex component SEC5A isoform X1 [Ricinus communis]XP_048226586.1 exocyst complex component SEC5A isofor